MTEDRDGDERGEELWQMMRNELEETYSREQRREHPPLYHYTSTAAAISILEKGEFWATHFRYVNDPGEFIVGERAFLHAAMRVKGGRRRHADVLDPICDSYEHHAISKRLDSYVVSFSTRPDWLSQWRAYAGGGAGYCLGFESVNPWNDEKDGEDPTWAAVLHECTYDEDSFVDRCARVIEAVLEAFEHLVAHNGEERTRLVKTAHRHILHLAAYLTPQLKDSGYVEEAEWRVVVLADGAPERVHFREHVLSAVPYFKLPMAAPKQPMALSTLTIGPTQDQERGGAAAQMLLRRFGYSSDLGRRSRRQMR
jgi:Protein of unknown function (DUF2971)